MAGEEAGINLAGEQVLPGGDHCALIDVSGGGISYSGDELKSLVQKFATALDLKPSERVGILSNNSAGMVAALLGAMRSGGVAVPINTKFPDSTVQHVVENASLRKVLCDDGNQSRVPNSHSLQPVDTENIFLYSPSAGDPAMVLYTSGSTGLPKGVELSHDSQWSMVSRMSRGLAGQTAIVAAPLYHMNGLLFLLSLLAGRGTVVLMARFDARSYLQSIAEFGVNVLTGVPTMLAMCLKENDLLDSLDLSSVTHIQVGSAPLSEAMLGPVSKAFPNAHISNGYGTTEAGAGMFGRHPDGIPVPGVALGYPQPHVEVRLVGARPDQEGVLEVKTPAAMTRYLNEPEKTAAKLSSDGWVNTGDVMRVDENGFYYFVGRADDMFVCGGENVYPGQIERLLEKDTRIQECCVVAMPDEIKGQLPVAFVVKRPDTDLSEEEVKQIALSGAPAYMHPRQVVFLDRMPLAGTNKIDRRVLEQEAERLERKGRTDP